MKKMNEAAFDPVTSVCASCADYGYRKVEPGERGRHCRNCGWVTNEPKRRDDERCPDCGGTDSHAPGCPALLEADVLEGRRPVKRLTKESLRRIIRQTIDRRLDESEGVIPNSHLDDTLDAISSAMVISLTKQLEQSDVAADAYEIVLGTIDDETAARPGRYEDVEYFAVKIVKQVLADEELTNALVEQVTQVLHRLMEPSG